MLRPPLCPTPSLRARVGLHRCSILVANFMLFPAAIIFQKKLKLSLQQPESLDMILTGKFEIARVQPCGLESDCKAAGVFETKRLGGKRLKRKQNIPLFTS